MKCVCICKHEISLLFSGIAVAKCIFVHILCVESARCTVFYFWHFKYVKDFNFHADRFANAANFANCVFQTRNSICAFVRLCLCTYT